MALPWLVHEDEALLTQFAFDGDSVLASSRLDRKVDRALARAADYPWREYGLAHVLSVVIHQHIRLTLNDVPCPCILALTLHIEQPLVELRWKVNAVVLGMIAFSVLGEVAADVGVFRAEGIEGVVQNAFVVYAQRSRLVLL